MQCTDSIKAPVNRCQYTDEEAANETNFSEEARMAE